MKPNSLIYACLASFSQKLLLLTYNLCVKGRSIFRDYIRTSVLESSIYFEYYVAFNLSSVGAFSQSKN